MAQLIAKVTAGQIETSRAREVLAEMIASGKSADEAIRAMGIQQLDETELITLGRELLQSNPKVLADLKAGNLKAAGWLIGQAKRKNPNVNPGRFREICLELAKEMRDER
jgi:aspartyl-tRNA(Asn)/glutamyl-tRNA(Gln) amidotransferase subunit B